MRIKIKITSELCPVIPLNHISIFAYYVHDIVKIEICGTIISVLTVPLMDFTEFLHSALLDKGGAGRRVMRSSGDHFSYEWGLNPERMAILFGRGADMFGFTASESIWYEMRSQLCDKIIGSLVKDGVDVASLADVSLLGVRSYS